MKLWNNWKQDIKISDWLIFKVWYKISDSDIWNWVKIKIYYKLIKDKPLL